MKSLCVAKMSKTQLGDPFIPKSFFTRGHGQLGNVEYIYLYIYSDLYQKRAHDNKTRLYQLLLADYSNSDNLMASFGPTDGK